MVRRFGDTKDKGGGSVQIWVKYESIGLEFTFEGKDWNDVANPINNIKIFTPTKQQTECTLCLKDLRLLDRSRISKCGGCGL